MRWEHYYWASSRELVHDQSRHGRLTDEFWEAYAHRQLVALGASNARPSNSRPKLAAYMSKSYEPQSVVPMICMERCRRWAARANKLVLSSNRDTPLQDVLARIGLAEHFPYSLASGEINAWKPDPRIFLHAANSWGWRPHEAAYVGDNYFADVVGAKRAGVLPVLYDPRGNLRRSAVAPASARSANCHAALRLNGRG